MRKPAQADRMLGEGKDVADVCRELGVAEQTYYRWRNQFGGLKADEAKRLKELEKENSTLKRLLADAELEKAALREIARGGILSPARRRAAVHHLIATMGVSERFACRVTGQYRTTQRHRAHAETPADPDAALRTWLRANAKDHPRWGFRRAYHDARGEGWVVNHKKLQRIWREEGLRVPIRARRKRLGTSTAPDTPKADAPNKVWAVDFQFDSTTDGRPVKIASIIDEHTRECRWLGRPRSPATSSSTSWTASPPSGATPPCCAATTAPNWRALRWPTGPANASVCPSSRPANRGATATWNRSTAGPGMSA